MKINAHSIKIRHTIIEYIVYYIGVKFH